MTVAELIEQLKQMPQDAAISISVGGENSDYIMMQHKEQLDEVELYST